MFFYLLLWSLGIDALKPIEDDRHFWDMFKLFLAATKQLYEWFSPSVCPSQLFDYVPSIVLSRNFQELLPMTEVMSMQKVNVKGEDELICEQLSFWSPPFRSRIETCLSELILGLYPANERRRYKVTPSLIGWAQTYNQPCLYSSGPLVVQLKLTGLPIHYKYYTGTLIMTACLLP